MEPQEAPPDDPPRMPPVPWRGFSYELKTGVPVLVHIAVGSVESATMRLLEEDDVKQLEIKTNRSGWRAWCCSCRNRYYLLGTGHVEMMPRRVTSIRLSASVKKLNAGDQQRTDEMLKRSISLLRRYPKVESIDLTLSSSELEERLRTWVNKELAIDSSLSIRHSSFQILEALSGRSPSQMTDADTAALEVDQSQQQQSAEEDGVEDRSALLPRAAAVYPASFGGARRGSLSEMRTQSQRMAIRRSSATSEASGAAESGRDVQFLSWKEPPSLRRIGSSQDKRGGRGKQQQKSLPSRAASVGSLSPPGPHVSLLHAGTPGSASSSRRNQFEPKGDFWDPLGLLNDMESRPSSSSAKKSPPPPPSQGEVKSLHEPLLEEVSALEEKTKDKDGDTKE